MLAFDAWMDAAVKPVARFKADNCKPPRVAETMLAFDAWMDAAVKPVARFKADNCKPPRVAEVIFALEAWIDAAVRPVARLSADNCKPPMVAAVIFALPAVMLLSIILILVTLTLLMVPATYKLPDKLKDPPVIISAAKVPALMVVPDAFVTLIDPAVKPVARFKADNCKAPRVAEVMLALETRTLEAVKLVTDSLVAFTLEAWMDPAVSPVARFKADNCKAPRVADVIFALLI